MMIAMVNMMMMGKYEIGSKSVTFAAAAAADVVPITTLIGAIAGE
jgi:hypothetical protein